MASKMLPGPRARLVSSLLRAEVATSISTSSSSISQAALPLTFARGVKYGWSNTKNPRDHTDKYNKGPGLPVLSASPEAALARKAFSTPLRTGALTYKVGMTAIYDPETGVRTPCTVLRFDRVQVTGHKRADIHGYWAVQVGCDTKQWRNFNRAELGQFEKAGVAPKRHLAEFRVKDKSGLLPLGTTLTPEWFFEGQYVDARADCKGKGFAGGMKKWGWAGQPASHGNSLSHRVMGSSGGSQGSGSRVIPGKHMPGRMGGHQHTCQNLKVLKTDEEKGVMIVKGCLSGANGSVVKIQDAIFKPWPDVAKLSAERAASKASTSTETKEAAKETA